MRRATWLPLLAVVTVSPAATWAADPAQAATALPESERGPYFIGDAIVNLRGLDPVILPGGLALIDGRRTPTRMSATPTVGTSTNTPLEMPAGWTAPALALRRACGAHGCDASVDLVALDADGTSRVIAARRFGEFIAMLRTQQVFDCDGVDSPGASGTPSLIDLHGTRTMLPAHPGPLLSCTRVGSGNEVLLVFNTSADGRTRTLARVFDARGMLLAERSFLSAGTLSYRVDGERYSVRVPRP